MVILCEKTGVEIHVNKTNGGKGRINLIQIYDANKKLQAVTHIHLYGNEMDFIKIN